MLIHPTTQEQDAQIIQALSAGMSIEQRQSSVDVRIGSSDLLGRAIASGEETRIELVRRAVSEALAALAAQAKQGEQQCLNTNAGGAATSLRNTKPRAITAFGAQTFHGDDMTHTSTEQPKALRLADWLNQGGWPSYVPQEAAAELHRQHARIVELEAQLESIGNVIDALPQYNRS